MLTKVLVGALFTALIGYGLFEAWPLISGPSLALQSPTEGASFEDGVVRVSGNVGRTSALTLNGTPVLPDEQGAFSTTLAFPSGTSILEIKATDRFGRKIIETRTIFVP